MNFTKKFDRAFQWAGEKMGAEAKTNLPEEFRLLETEMALRIDGMEKLQKSMSAYVKWMSKRGDSLEDKEKGSPLANLGRTMVSHGNDFETDSEFGRCLVALGRGNERLSGIQEKYSADATSTWLESVERTLAMMKEYQSARKKLDSRRLAYDANISKMQKARRDDFKIEEELRTSKAKFDESCEDVVRRMQDIKDAEAESARDLTGFLDVELDYHERCVEELRRVKQSWVTSTSNGQSDYRANGRIRPNTSRTYSKRSSRDNVYDDDDAEVSLSRAPTHSSFKSRSPPPDPPRPSLIGRSSAFQGPSTIERRLSGNQSANAEAVRAQPRPVHRIMTDVRYGREDVFADRDDDTASDSGSPEWGNRSLSPATSLGSLSRSTTSSALGRKAPPPPPPSRSKKPPPPVPVKRDTAY